MGTRSTLPYGNRTDQLQGPGLFLKPGVKAMLDLRDEQNKIRPSSSTIRGKYRKSERQGKAMCQKKGKIQQLCLNFSQYCVRLLRTRKQTNSSVSVGLCERIFNTVKRMKVIDDKVQIKYISCIVWRSVVLSGSTHPLFAPLMCAGAHVCEPNPEKLLRATLSMDPR